jgi:phage terminase large subunit-like protein
MVEATIRQVNKRVAYRGVHASRGKQVRAEPVAAIYEQGRGHHVGRYDKLEDELCLWLPGDDSPNRLDALVWAATELIPNHPEYGKPGLSQYA